MGDYYDLEAAKALLAEAGYPDGFDMTITVNSAHTPHVNTAQVLVEQLREVGIRASVQPVDSGTWMETPALKPLLMFMQLSSYRMPSLKPCFDQIPFSQV